MSVCVGVCCYVREGKCGRASGVSPPESRSPRDREGRVRECVCASCVFLCVCVRVCWCVLEKERVAGWSPCRTEAGNEREAV